MIREKYLWIIEHSPYITGKLKKEKEKGMRLLTNMNKSNNSLALFCVILQWKKCKVRKHLSMPNLQGIYQGVLSNAKDVQNYDI